MVTLLLNLSRVQSPDPSPRLVIACLRVGTKPSLNLAISQL